MQSPLNQSRFSKPDTQFFRSTGTSLVFKTVSRSTKPSWSNRIVKDVNDLQYTIDIDLLGKAKFRSVTLENRRKANLSAEKKGKVSAREKRREFFTEELNKILKSARFFAAKEVKDSKREEKKPQHYKHKSSTIQKFGLCDYEFNNTINGKLLTKPNLHLKFDKKAARNMQSVIQPCWYNPQLQINLTSPNPKKYRRILDKYHSFESYTQRRVFQTKETSESIYEIENGKRRTSPNRIKRTVAIDTVPGRKDQPVKESSYLSYEVRRGERVTRKGSPKYSINDTPKEFTFSKQVISDQRGCYR